LRNFFFSPLGSKISLLDRFFFLFDLPFFSRFFSCNPLHPPNRLSPPWRGSGLQGWGLEPARGPLGFSFLIPLNLPILTFCVSPHLFFFSSPHTPCSRSKTALFELGPPFSHFFTLSVPAVLFLLYSEVFIRRSFFLPLHLVLSFRSLCFWWFGWGLYPMPPGWIIVFLPPLFSFSFFISFSLLCCFVCGVSGCVI